MAEVLGSHHGDLSVHGLKCSGNIHWNLSVEELVELAVSRGEGVYSAHKALVTETGKEQEGRPMTNSLLMSQRQVQMLIGAMSMYLPTWQHLPKCVPR